VWLGNGTGTFGDGSLPADAIGGPVINYAIPEIPSWLAAGSFGSGQGGGPIDLAAAYPASNEAGMRLSQGNGAFSLSVPLSVGILPTSLAVGDLNTDGLLDLVTANQASLTVSVLLGRLPFASAASYSVGNGMWEVALGNFNPDDILDVATVYPNNAGTTGSVTLLPGIGDGTLNIDAAVSFDVKTAEDNRDIHNVDDSRDPLVR